MVAANPGYNSLWGRDVHGVKGLAICNQLREGRKRFPQAYPVFNTKWAFD